MVGDPGDEGHKQQPNDDGSLQTTPGLSVCDRHTDMGADMALHHDATCINMYSYSKDKSYPQSI